MQGGGRDLAWVKVVVLGLGLLALVAGYWWPGPRAISPAPTPAMPRQVVTQQSADAGPKKLRGIGGWWARVKGWRKREL